MSDPLTIRTIRIRRDTASNWNQKNTVLRLGEPGLETDTRKLKFGDGVTSWNNLQYSGIDINDSAVLENIDDRVAGLIKAGSNISVSYNDDTNELTIGAVGLQLAGDYATLVNGRVPASQLPSYVDDVIEVANFSTLPSSGESGKIYVTLENNKTYRWSGSTYVEISASPGSTDAVPEGSVNKYYTDTRASAAAPVQSVNGQTGSVLLSKSDVGLGDVDNTSDVNKPVSTAQAAADSAVQSAAESDATAKADAAKDYAIQRSNHTGTQSSSTISDFSTAASAAAPVQSVAGRTGAVTLNKNDVGLTNVDNTSDASKPISTATQTALDAKAPIANPTFTGTVSGITKNMVGLGNVDNTSDINKPVSTAQAAAINNKASIPSYTQWSSTTLPAGLLLGQTNCFAYGNGLFIAIPQNTNVIVTSPDGINWTERTLPTTGSWQSVAYGNGIFVIVGFGSTALTSSDGITWTSRSFPTSNPMMVTYGQGLFVTVPIVGTSALTSTDGITWTSSTLPVNGGWRAITYGNNMFVAVGHSIGSPITSSFCATSTNGIDWTQRSLPIIESCDNVQYGNNTFVIGGSANFLVSPDGITWTSYSRQTNAIWPRIAYGNGFFVETTLIPKRLAISRDGINWSSVSTSIDGTRIAYGDGTFVVFNTTIAHYSSETVFNTKGSSSVPAPVQRVAGKTGVVTLTKGDVGLNNIDNTSDVNKPVSTAQAAADTAVQNAAASDATTKANNAQAFAIQRSNHTGTQAISTVNGLQTALDGKAATSHTHDDRYYTESETDALLATKQASGDYATLVNGTVPASQLPSYVDDVIEVADLASLPVGGESGKIYVTLDNNKTYRWSGSSYVEISASPGSTDAVPEGSVNKYYTDARASAAAPVQSVSGKTGVVTLSKNDVGLTNVDNTSDVNKPVSIATQTALDGKSSIDHTHDSNSHIVCKVGDDLAAKYNAAKVLTPGGNALSATNRATLIIMPGNYTVTSPLSIDTNFVDVIGLGSVKLERGAIPAVNLSGGIRVSAANVRVKGISVGTSSFAIFGDQANQVFEDCVGGNNSFVSGSVPTPGSTNNTASGTFTNCSGGNNSFGGGDAGWANGTFANCSGGNYSFGGFYGAASGSFVNCSGGNYSFGGGGTASGTFKDCSGGNYSFGGGGTASGIFLKCILTSGSFATLSSGGKYRLCVDGDYNVINADYIAP